MLAGFGAFAGGLYATAVGISGPPPGKKSNGGEWLLPSSSRIYLGAVRDLIMMELEQQDKAGPQLACMGRSPTQPLQFNTPLWDKIPNCQAHIPMLGKDQYREAGREAPDSAGPLSRPVAEVIPDPSPEGTAGYPSRGPRSGEAFFPVMSSEELAPLLVPLHHGADQIKATFEEFGVIPAGCLE
eukprot:s1324_g23.t1